MKRSIKIVIIIVLAVAVIAAVALGVLGGAYRYFDYLGSETFDASGADYGRELVVMTFNIRRTTINDLGKKSWFHRAEGVVKTIAERAPDLIGFQEMTPEQEKYLRAHLQGYVFFAVYRDDKRSSEAPGVAYRADRFEEKERGSFWLSETPEKMSKDWDSAYYRNANYVILRDKTYGEEFAFCNTHLDNVSEQARVNGANVIIDKMGAKDLPTIVTGDFNDLVGSGVYDNMLRCGFSDSRENAEYADSGKQEITFHDYGKSDPLLLDYCFVNGVSRVESYEIIHDKVEGGYPSDHFPVIVKMVV